MELNPEPQKRIVVMETCKNMRKLGRTALEGKWLKATAVAALFYILIEVPTFVINYFFGREVVVDMAKQFNLGPEFKDAVYSFAFSPMSNIYVLLVTGPLVFGMTLFFIRMFRNSNAQISDIFKGFEQFIRTMGLFLYILLFIILWAFIPLAGIILAPIAALRYSQSFLIMIDHPEYSIPMCVRESKRIMVLNKGKLFILMLSFIGWVLLAGVFMGIVEMPIINLVSIGSLSDPASMSGALELDYSTIFITELLAIIISSPLMAYMSSTSIAFYEILTGKIQAEVYYPGEY